MKSESPQTAKARPRLRLDLPGLVILLLCLTLLSVCLASRMLARYTTGDGSQDGARVARAGNVAVLEYQATYNEAAFRYEIDPTSLVQTNTYEMVVPGMSIEKNPFAQLDGQNDVTSVLYLEVKPSEDGLVNYTVTDQWVSVTDDSEFAPQHGGTVYRYQQDISPHQTGSFYILKDNQLHVREDFKDKNTPDFHKDPFHVDLYAYLVQKD